MMDLQVYHIRKKNRLQLSLKYLKTLLLFQPLNFIKHLGDISETKFNNKDSKNKTGHVSSKMNGSSTKYLISHVYKLFNS